MKVSPAWSDTFYFWPIPFYFDLYTFSIDAKAQKKRHPQRDVFFLIKSKA